MANKGRVADATVRVLEPRFLEEELNLPWRTSKDKALAGKYNYHTTLTGQVVFTEEDIETAKAYYRKFYIQCELAEQLEQLLYQNPDAADVIRLLFAFASAQREEVEEES